ncbi:hypothetical protein MTR_3g451960 [Medicago truncatula]|uniref:Uncharacterized protein n=1 Tax=Medicago truncatula TaxID=3880 RepID=A0A072UXF0_MEDTR|nr:hypothetical protein MTR_3g451960 [Medicago truncatula]
MEAELLEAEWCQNRYDQLNLIEEKCMAALCHGQLYQTRMKQAFDKKIENPKGRSMQKLRIVTSNCISKASLTWGTLAVKRSMILKQSKHCNSKLGSTPTVVDSSPVKGIPNEDY